MLFWCAVLCEHLYTVFAFLFLVLLTDLLCHMSCHVFVCSNIFIVTFTHFWLLHASVFPG